MKNNHSDFYVYKYNSTSNDNFISASNNYDNLSEKSEKQNITYPIINPQQQSISQSKSIINTFPKKKPTINNYIKTSNYENYELNKIKSQIEVAGKNMIGDMSQIISNITDEENNFKNQLIEMDKRYKNRINELQNSKNKIIVNLKNKINEINRQNDSLMNELSNIENDNQSKCDELTNVIENLKNKINSKEDEIYKMKQYLNEQNNLINKNREDETNGLCYLYEKKINDILNISDNNQLKLLNIIKEKDRIIQELININGNKSSDYNDLINKIQRENESYKDIAQKSIHLAGSNINNNFINSLNPKNMSYQKDYKISKYLLSNKN